jgi:transposase InsO family protein
VREERIVPTAPNQTWAMDFMHDMLADGTKIRLLTIVDSFSRESVALEVGFGFKSTEVVDVLRRKVAERGTPQRISCDNGPEFVSLQLDQWAYWNRVKLDFSRPGKPSDNAVCESFNNRVRQELLNPNWFDRSKICAYKPRLGVLTTTPITRTARWEIFHRMSTLGEQRTSLQKPPFLEGPWRKNGEASNRRQFWSARGITIGGRPALRILHLFSEPFSGYTSARRS